MERLSRSPNVTVLPRTTAFGYYAQNFVGLVERIADHLADAETAAPRERLWQVRAREVVLAAGAIERPVVFPGNDRPGVMLADAARTYLHRYGVKPGSSAVVVTADDAAYRTAVELHDAGVAIAAIADLREQVAGEAADAARSAGIAVHPATGIARTEGRLRVKSVELAPATGGRGARIACDLVLMSGGWTPSVHLFSQSRGKLAYDDALGAFVPGTSVQRERSAGGCRGTFGLAAAIAEGRAAGAGAPPPPPALRATTSAVSRGRTASHRRSAGKGKAFVDFQNDVTTKDLKLAVREGFRAIEHVKRYTTTGMATDQGKTSNLNALDIVAADINQPVPAVGLTTFRVPYTPVTFGALAGTSRGELFDPVRMTPIHGWAEEQGAVFEDVGLWKRARYFPRGGEDMDAAVARECRAVRTGVGIFDASTLGKIEVVGPDAAEFLNRMYTNAWSKLAVGRCRYGLMLTEAGFVMDDGIVGRIAHDRFHVTTTTGGAPRVLHHMRTTADGFTDPGVCDFDDGQWTVIAVQGRHARDVISPLVGHRPRPHPIPHERARGRIAGVPGRLFRVSFTSETGYEINVPSRYGREVWEAVHDSGRAFGITPYGTEAMHVLRAEKGYIIVGQESDGTVIPSDLGLSGMVSETKPDFVGKRSLRRPDMLKPDRKQLVGLLTADPKTVLEEGAQIVADEAVARQLPAPMLGHVTSSYMSATLGRSIALAMVSGGQGRIGQQLVVAMPGRTIAVDVVAPLFYDPEGTR